MSYLLCAIVFYYGGRKYEIMGDSKLKKLEIVLGGMTKFETKILLQYLCIYSQRKWCEGGRGQDVEDVGENKNVDSMENRNNGFRRRRRRCYELNLYLIIIWKLDGKGRLHDDGKKKKNWWTLSQEKKKRKNRWCEKRKRMM